MRHTNNTKASSKGPIFALPFVLCLSTTLFATWALVPLEQLVAKSDLIVTGTLYSAAEDSHGIGHGYIRVETIVWGKALTMSEEPLKPGDKLKIKWADDWGCAAGMHMGRQGKPGVWLLEVKGDGSVSAAYPGRFTPLEKLDDIRNLAERTRTKRFPSVHVDIPEPRADEAKAVEFQIVDISPFRENSPVGAAVVLMIATALYWLLYKSRFRIR